MDEFVCDVEAVKAWLYSYRERERDLDNQIERLDVMESKLYSIGSPSLSDMPKAATRVNDKTARMIEDFNDLKSEVSAETEEQKRIKNLIESVLKCLKKSDEKAVIRIRYLDVSSWGDVNKVIFGKREDFVDKEDTYLRRTHKLHGSALQNIADYVTANQIPEILSSMLHTLH